MFESIANASNLGKAFFLMLIGMAEVFAALIFFYLLIKILIKVFAKSSRADN